MKILNIILNNYYQPIRSKTKTNRDLLAHIFPRLQIITRTRNIFCLTSYYL